MRLKFYEFIVKGVASGESGYLQVIGRCGDLPIRVDDCFDRLFCYKPRTYPQEAGRAPERCQEKQVALRVVCIHAYERSLPELGEGMTGSLALDGVGADQVAPGWILGKGQDFQPTC